MVGASVCMCLATCTCRSVVKDTTTLSPRSFTFSRHLRKACFSMEVLNFTSAHFWRGGKLVYVARPDCHSSCSSPPWLAPARSVAFCWVEQHAESMSCIWQRIRVSHTTHYQRGPTSNLPAEETAPFVALARSDWDMAFWRCCSKHTAQLTRQPHLSTLLLQGQGYLSRQVIREKV